MGFLPNIRKKIKGAVNKVTTAKNNALNMPVITKVKAKTIGAVKSKISNAAQSKGFIVLAPYKQVMRAILKKRGHQTSNNASIKDITLLFYDAVIRGIKNFNYNHYSEYGRQHIDASSAIATGGSIGIAAATGGVIPPAATKGIIEAILNWFKNIGNKKAQGQPLQEEEKMAAEADQKIEEKGIAVGVDSPNFLVKLMRALFGTKKENFRRRIDARNKRPAMAKNMPKNSVVNTPSNLPTRPMVNATELGMAMTTQNAVQNYVLGHSGMSANSLVNITPNMGELKRKPNTYYKGKGYTDHKGVLIGKYDEVQHLVKLKPNTFYKGKGYTDHKGRLIK